MQTRLLSWLPALALGLAGVSAWAGESAEGRAEAALQPGPETERAHASGAEAPDPEASAGGPSEDDVPAEAVLAELPFLDRGTNRIFVDLAPEASAKPLELLLDTGASDTVLTPRHARQLGVNVRRSKRTPYRRKTRLGRDLHFWIDTASSDTASKTGFEYGLLGGTFLSHYVVELDFERRLVRFLDPGVYRVPEAAEASDVAILELSTPANRPHARVAIDGHEIRALFDTGDPFSMSLLDKSAADIGIARQAIAGLEIWGVLGPISDLSFGRARSLALGRHDVGSAPLVFSPSSYNMGDATGAVVGFDVLSQFVVRIDYARRRLWLRPIQDRPMTFLAMDWPSAESCGAFLRRDGVDLWVEYVLAGTPAAALGLEPRDRIVATAQTSEPEIARVAEQIRRGAPIEVLRRSDGGWVSLSLGAEADVDAAAAAGDAP